MYPARDNEDARSRMLNEQLRGRGISDPRVLAAMGRVPRTEFLPEKERPHAYADRALPIDCGQTMSQPYIVALMSQALELSGDEHVLEIGTGSGYQAAILGELARSVVTIERHPRLAQQAAAKLAQLGYKNVRAIEGDGMVGSPADAPFDRIIVTAASRSVPEAVWQQLAEGGLLVIPEGGQDFQELKRIRKTGGQPVSEVLCDCRFVPLLPHVANQTLTQSGPKVQ
jgi:protein-L-isoaspartate(D-aspartate) O-methyltransferase